MVDNDYLDEVRETIELLRAMYPLESEVELSTETECWLSQGWRPSSELTYLEITIHTLLEDSDEKHLDILINLPLEKSSECRVQAKQPDWLSRQSYDDLLAKSAFSEQENVPLSQDILDRLEHIKSEARNILGSIQAQQDASAADLEQTDKDLISSEIQRVWFWFPSLSSKEKRRDMVDYAPEYGLTGFVMAGKPGLLCLEGDGAKVDRYISAIKSKSWSDIPSYQKKVTERLRKPISVDTRRFTSMTDITHLVPQHGQYNHRGEMSKVKELMDQWGVGEDFNAVVMNMQS